MNHYFDIIRNMEHNDAVKALGALAHANRLAVVRLLLEHAPAGLPAGALGERLGLAPATLSFHLKELARTGARRHEARGSLHLVSRRSRHDERSRRLSDRELLPIKAAAACCAPITPKPRIVARHTSSNA